MTAGEFDELIALARIESVGPHKLTEVIAKGLYAVHRSCGGKAELSAFLPHSPEPERTVEEELAAFEAYSKKRNGHYQ